MKKILIIFGVFLLLSFGVNAQTNPKTIDYVKLRIVQSGTLEVSGIVERSNLSYYIPQSGILNIAVTADGDMTWRYITDSFGNKLVLMEWKKPAGDITYTIDMTVENRAQYSTEKSVGTNDLYLRETQYITIDDNIRQYAFPYEKSMKRAAELTAFVYDYVTYDLSYVGRNVPSDQVLLERRGVCVEHANLLAALLRANGIPTRYVVGYAFSSVQNDFIGHTWVEVLASDGSWVPFDPTWLEGGYLDATHIKSAALLDNSQLDTLSYLGGRIEWTRNDEKITLLSQTESPETSISATGTPDIASDGYGYVKAALTPRGCSLSSVTASSCVDRRGENKFEIYEANRSVWTCSSKEVYWFFKTSDSGYICPLTIYDQTGGSTDYSVAVHGSSGQQAVSISGPDIVGTNEQFMITPSKNGILYSPELGIVSGPVSITKPGIYKFYLYADGLYVKTVSVVQKKEFNLKADAPTTIKLGGNFNATAQVRNLLDSRVVNIIVDYTNQSIKRSVQMDSGEERNFSFTLTANMEGLNELTISATGNSLATQTIVINTPFERDGIFGAISGFFAAIANWFSSLFK